MDDLLERYVNHLRSFGASRATIRLRLGHAASLLRLGPLDTLTTADVEAWLNSRHRSYAAETLKSRRASARALLGWLHEEGELAHDLSRRLRPVRVLPAPPRVAVDADIARALERASARDRAAILLARYALLRLSELTTLPLSARRGDELRVHGKGGRWRLLYPHEDVLHALDALEAEVDGRYYFPGLSGPHMHPQSMHKIIKRATGWHPHALRHAGASATYRETGNLRAVQLMLGHASLATTQRYLSLDEEALRAVGRGVALRAA